MTTINALITEHEALQQAEEVDLDRVQALVARVREAGAYIKEAETRNQLNAILAHWANVVFEREGARPATDLAPYREVVRLEELDPPEPPRTSLTDVMTWAGWLLAVLLVVLVIFTVVSLWPDAAARPTPTPTIQPTPTLPVIPTASSSKTAAEPGTIPWWVWGLPVAIVGMGAAVFFITRMPRGVKVKQRHPETTRSALALRALPWWIWAGAVVVVLGIAAVALLSSGIVKLPSSETPQPPTATIPVATTAAPTPTTQPPPTVTPTPAPPTATPTATAIPLPADEAQGDVATYDTGAPVADAPGGFDLRRAGIAQDLAIDLQPGAAIPLDLGACAGEGEALLWMALYAAIPEQPGAFSDWTFALDLDGDPATGRPPGTRRIDVGLGDDAIIGVSYDPGAGAFEPYLLIWQTTAGTWQAGPDIIKVCVDPTRTLLGLAFPLQTLAEQVTQANGVTLNPDAVRGRAAVLTTIGGQRTIDLYPNEQ